MQQEKMILGGFTRPSPVDEGSTKYSTVTEDFVFEEGYEEERVHPSTGSSIVKSALTTPRRASTQESSSPTNATGIVKSAVTTPTKASTHTSAINTVKSAATTPTKASTHTNATGIVKSAATTPTKASTHTSASKTVKSAATTPTKANIQSSSSPTNTVKSAATTPTKANIQSSSSPTNTVKSAATTPTKANIQSSSSPTNTVKSAVTTTTKANIHTSASNTVKSAATTPKKANTHTSDSNTVKSAVTTTTKGNTHSSSSPAKTVKSAATTPRQANIRTVSSNNGVIMSSYESVIAAYIAESTALSSPMKTPTAIPTGSTPTPNSTVSLNEPRQHTRVPPSTPQQQHTRVPATTPQQQPTRVSPSTPQQQQVHRPSIPAHHQAQPHPYTQPLSVYAPPSTPNNLSVQHIQPYNFGIPATLEDRSAHHQASEVFPSQHNTHATYARHLHQLSPSSVQSRTSPPTTTHRLQESSNTQASVFAVSSAMDHSYPPHTTTTTYESRLMPRERVASSVHTPTPTLVSGGSSLPVDYPRTQAQVPHQEDATTHRYRALPSPGLDVHRSGYFSTGVANVLASTHTPASVSQIERNRSQSKYYATELYGSVYAQPSSAHPINSYAPQRGYYMAAGGSLNGYYATPSEYAYSSYQPRNNLKVSQTEVASARPTGAYGAPLRASLPAAERVLHLEAATSGAHPTIGYHPALSSRRTPASNTQSNEDKKAKPSISEKSKGYTLHSNRPFSMNERTSHHSAPLEEETTEKVEDKAPANTALALFEMPILSMGTVMQNTYNQLLRAKEVLLDEMAMVSSRIRGLGYSMNCLKVGDQLRFDKEDIIITEVDDDSKAISPGRRASYMRSKAALEN